MNKKLFRTVFAVFLAVFMCGTSVNPAVFAIDNEPETETEKEEPKTEEGNDTKKVITEFVLGDLPAEVENAEELPDKLPATLEGEAAETADVAVEWAGEDVFTAELTSDSKNTYTLSKDAENQLNDISVKKTEVNKKGEEVAPEEGTGSDEPDKSVEPGNVSVEPANVALKGTDPATEYEIKTTTYQGVDVTLDKTSAAAGTEIDVTVTLLEGYYLTNLYYTIGDESKEYYLNKSESGKYNFTMPEGPVTIHANCNGLFPGMNVSWNENDGVKTTLLEWEKPSGTPSEIGEPTGYKIQVVTVGTGAQYSNEDEVKSNTFSYDCKDLIKEVLPTGENANHSLIRGTVTPIYGNSTIDVNPGPSRSGDLKLYKVAVTYDQSKLDVSGEDWYIVESEVAISAKANKSGAKVLYEYGNGYDPSEEEWNKDEGTLTFPLDQDHINKGYTFIKADMGWKVTFHLYDDKTTVIDVVDGSSTPDDDIDDPKRDGYAFCGWYADSDFKEEFSFYDDVTKNTDVYAKWLEEKEISVVLEMGSDHEQLAEAIEAAYNDPNMEERRPQYMKELTREKASLTFKVNNVDEGELVTVGTVQRDLYSLVEHVIFQTRADELHTFINVAQKGIDNYEDERDIYEEMEKSKGPLPDTKTFYALYGELIDELEVTVTAPKCGTDITVSKADYGRTIQSPAPEANITTEHASVAPDDEEYMPQSTYWLESLDESPKYVEGNIVGGQSYIAAISVSCDFGYKIGPETKITINGEKGEIVQSGHTNIIAGNVMADHDWAEPTYTWADDYSTCTGTAKCKHYETCDGSVTETVKTESRMLEPTETEYGLVGYRAPFTNKAFNEQYNIRVLSPLSKKYTAIKGMGSVYTKGSKTQLEFEVKASEKDELTHKLFVKIAVDGKTVGTGNYSTRKGSVVIDLKPDYLETLSVGGHTLSVYFEDSLKAVDIPFSVKNKSSGGSSDKKPTTPVDNVVTCQMAGYPSNYSWNESAKACQPGYIDAGGTFHPYRRSMVPNTADYTNPLYAWIFMLTMTLAMYCGVRLMHEDWEV